MEGVTLPNPPDGYEYRLVKMSTKKKPRINNKDPSELTSRQLATLKYREKNKDKISEYLRTYYEKTKKNEEENKKPVDASGLPNN